MRENIKQLDILILAGGLGSRLKGVISGIPKPMAPVNGKPFLDHLLEYWINKGVASITLSVGYLSEIIINNYGNKFKGCPIRYLKEESPLGTGGAILKYFYEVKPNSPFIVANGDTVFPVSINELMAFHKRSNSSLTMAVFRSCNTNRYSGINCSSEGRILRFGEEIISTNNATDMLCNGGTYIIEHHLIEIWKEFLGRKVSLETELISHLIDKNISCYAYAFENKFLDIGIPSDYERAASFIN